MNRPAFTFDDVCFTPDCQIGYHSHPQWELSLLICGAGVRSIGNLKEPMVEGEIILIPPGIPHVWQFESTRSDAEGNISNISIFFETATLENLSLVIPELESTVYKIKSLTEAINIKGKAYHKVHKLLLSMRGLSASARVPLMIELLLTVADVQNSIFAGRNNQLSRTQQRLEKVRIFCDCNHSRQIRLEELAAHAGMNKSAFCTFMRRNTGMSLSEFVNDIRLRKAVEMLCHSDKLIADIAYDVGFANITYFNRLFRKKYNCTSKSVKEKQILPE